MGTSSRYAQNGQKLEETVRDGVNTLRGTQWYPEGAVMVSKKYDPLTHRLAEAASFDRNGTPNGKVLDGEGALILSDGTDGSGSESFHREIYRKDGPPSRKPLPGVRWSSANENENAIAMQLAVVEAADFEELECVIQPPKPGEKPIKIHCRLEDPDPKALSIKIPLPNPYAQWAGAIYGQTTVKGHAGTFHFTQIVYSKKPERPASRTPSQNKPEKPNPVPRPISSASLGRMGAASKTRIEIDGLAFPPLAKSLAGWSLEDGLWVLFRDPAALIYRESRRAPWVVVRKFDYRPAGFVLLAKDQLLLWGTRPTSTPQRGIPYVVERSLDSGKEWKPLPVPSVDYLTAIKADRAMLLVSGIRLPKEGLPPGKDWFALPKTHFISNDKGQHYTEMVGPGFPMSAVVIATVPSPDGRKRAYVADASFLDPGYEIDLAEEPDAIPRRVLFVGIKPELVWSADSQVIGLRHEDTFFACYDIAEGRMECGEEELLSDQPLTRKQQEAVAERDRKIRLKLGIPPKK